jgi:hypothetical protein
MRKPPLDPTVADIALDAIRSDRHEHRIRRCRHFRVCLKYLKSGGA